MSAEDPKEESLEEGLKETPPPAPQERLPWFTIQPSLPFDALSAAQFEMFCWRLVQEEFDREGKGQRAVRHGNTGDSGRDIVIKNGDGTHIIQCKNLGQSVGGPEVRAELAKLCTNIFRKKLKQPKKYTVFAAKDFSSDGLDLLDGDWDHWVKAQEKALDKHCGRKKASAELKAFGVTWKIDEVDHKCGAELTERAKKLADAGSTLIEEYFTLREASTTPLQRDTNRKVTTLLALEKGGVEAALALVPQLEAMNPGMSFEARLRARTWEFTVEPKGPGHIEFKSIAFRDSEEGRLAREKFRLFMERDHAATFTEAEIAWEDPIQMPDFGDSSTTTRTLTISREKPDKPIPIRIAARVGGKERAVIPFANSLLLRAGTHEFEAKLHGGQFAAELFLTVPADSPMVSFSAKLFWGRVPAEQAKFTASFFDVVSRGAEVELTNLETGTRIFVFEIAPNVVRIPELPRVQFALANLATLSEELGADLRYPAKGTRRDYDRLGLLCRALKNTKSPGVVEEKRPMLLTVPCTAKVAQLIVKCWRNKARLSLSCGTWENWTLDEKPLPIGKVITHILRVRPVLALQKIEKQIADVPEGQKFDLQMSATVLRHSLVERFPGLLEDMPPEIEDIEIDAESSPLHRIGP